MSDSTPFRQIRALTTERTITVYQAYAPEIAGPAAVAGRFVPPFSRTRMTWIKPSLRWMAYRCGWATKPQQERALAIEITRDGFEWALANSCLSHFESGTYTDHDAWQRRKDAAPVRIQWDPERDLRLAPLGHRSIQIGIGGSAVARYVDEWTESITDITTLVHRIAGKVRTGNLDAATALLPAERPYALTPELAAAIGATT